MTFPDIQTYQRALNFPGRILKDAMYLLVIAYFLFWSHFSKYRVYVEQGSSHVLQFHGSLRHIFLFQSGIRAFFKHFLAFYKIEGLSGNRALLLALISSYELLMHTIHSPFGNIYVISLISSESCRNRG